MAITPKPAIVPFTLHGEGNGVAQNFTTAGAIQHQFRTDAYPAFGGADSAPSPLFYALASLASCNQVTAGLVAKDLGIRLGAWTFDVRGDLDTNVLVNGVEGNANFDRVEVRVTVETDAAPDQFSRLISETERRCPVTQLFQRSGLEFVNDWSPAPLLATAEGR